MNTQSATPSQIEETSKEMFRAEQCGITVTMNQLNEVTVIEEQGPFLTDTLFQKACKMNALAAALLNQNFESLNDDNQRDLRWLMADLTNEVCALARLVNESCEPNAKYSAAHARARFPDASLSPEAPVAEPEPRPARDAYADELMRRVMCARHGQFKFGKSSGDPSLTELAANAAAEHRAATESIAE